MIRTPMDLESKIAVTGGTGLVGSYLLRLLVHLGHRNIWAMRRANSSMDLVAEIEDKINWMEADLLDTNALYRFFEGVDYAFHCAALVSFDPRERENLFRVNVNGTAEVVNACIHHKVKRLIHCSSVAALGKPLSGNVIDEETEWKSGKRTSQYGLSKYKAELEIWRGMGEGLSTVIVNPSLTLGGGHWHRGSLKLIRSIAKGMPFYPSGTGGFVDVRDLATMLVAVADHQFKGERFICCAENKSYKKVIYTLSDTFNVKPPKRPIKGWLIPFIPPFFRLLRFLGWRIPRVSRDILRSSHENNIFDNSKSQKQIPFEYRPLNQTLREVGQLYMNSRKSTKDYGLLHF